MYIIEADDWHDDSGFTAVKQVETREEYFEYIDGALDMSFRLIDEDGQVVHCTDQEGSCE